jgi:hypothetical protein
MMILLISIFLGLVVLVFSKGMNRPKSCNISKFLKSRTNKGTCPAEGALKSAKFCKVPCENEDDAGEITVSCSSTGKTNTTSTCTSALSSASDSDSDSAEFSPGDLQFFNSSPNLPTIQTQSKLIRILKVLNNTLCTDDCVDLHSAIPEDTGGNAVAFLPGHKIFGDGSWTDYIFTLRSAIMKSGLSAAEIAQRVAYDPETLEKCKNSKVIENNIKNLVTVVTTSQTIPLDPVASIVKQMACACRSTKDIPAWCN